ncbi:MAG TPA: hypothetical protein EYH31_11640 [Anaerolineae bacterium]|nr:hypothetical protein [Anaerolineae bacterium]
MQCARVAIPVLVVLLTAMLLVWILLSALAPLSGAGLTAVSQPAAFAPVLASARSLDILFVENQGQLPARA